MKVVDWDSFSSSACPRCGAPSREGLCEAEGCWHLSASQEMASRQAWRALREALAEYHGVTFRPEFAFPGGPDQEVIVVTNMLWRWMVAHMRIGGNA